MLIARTGDLLAVTDGVIAHGCNAQGVMGAGVAAAIREKWPHVYEQYRGWCEAYSADPRLLMGKVQIVKIDDGLSVANCVTQFTTGRGRQVSYDAVDTAMRTLDSAAPEGARVHLPAIGAGLGGGDWTVIRTIVGKALSNRVTTVWLHGDAAIHAERCYTIDLMAESMALEALTDQSTN